MSWVSNLLIAIGREDWQVVRDFSEWLEKEAPRRYLDASGNPVTGVGSLGHLTRPDVNQWGGWKNPECSVWGGALNHADLRAVVGWVERAPWRRRGRLQLLVQDQEESYFRLFMFRDGRLRQYAPPPPPDADEQHAWLSEWWQDEPD